MTCDAIRNRLLAEPNPAQPAAELRAHLIDCGSCREFLTRYESVAAQIIALPAPQSELAKIAFLDSLGNAGPILRSTPAHRPSVHWRSVAKPLAATAAALAVGIGLWAIATNRPTVNGPAYVRHDLLKRVVASNTMLARTADARARIDALTNLANDLRGEARDVVNAAPTEDLNALAIMYEEVVTKGLVKQAEQMGDPATTPPATRKAVLSAAAAKLAQAADEANEQARRASDVAKPAFVRIAASAAVGRSHLLRIADGGTGS